jgi:hypothetical protein
MNTNVKAYANSRAPAVVCVFTNDNVKYKVVSLF